MGVGTLRDDLLNLPGVEQAEIDGDSVTPAGVRVRLSPGVDPAAIGEDIRRVLSLHGLRQEIDAAPGPERSDVASSSEPETVELLDSDDELREREPEVPEPPARTDEGLDWVSVTEGRDGIMVTAASRSDEVTVFTAGFSEHAIDQAVVSAVAKLALTASVPLVCSLDERDLAGTFVVTVVLEESGRRLAGSAVVEGGRAYAVGRAVWTALSTR